MTSLHLVTYCGLYCSLCGERARIPQQAQALRDTMTAEGYEFLGPEQPGFPEFWAFLSRLCEPDECCPGCRQGGGPPFCGIRKCARRRGVEICALCDEFPCERVNEVAQGYPTLIADGRRLRQIGTEAWVAEQEGRARTGFAYADVRCYPYSVPED